MAREQAAEELRLSVAAVERVWSFAWAWRFQVTLQGAESGWLSFPDFSEGIDRPAAHG